MPDESKPKKIRIKKMGKCPACGKDGGYGEMIHLIPMPVTGSMMLVRDLMVTCIDPECGIRFVLTISNDAPFPIKKELFNKMIDRWNKTTGFDPEEQIEQTKEISVTDVFKKLGWGDIPKEEQK
jgi:hypothetical protein